MLLPDPFGEIGAAEAPAIALDIFERLGLAVEHGIDRIQRPGLIENDGVAEQALAIEHRSDVVQIVEQKRRRADIASLFAKGEELVLRNELLALRVHFFQPRLHGGAPLPDHGHALLAPQPLHGFGQRLVQRRAAAIFLRAVMQHLLEGKSVERFVVHGRAKRLLLRQIALRLHHDHRRLLAAKFAHIVQPIAERLIAEREAAIVVLVKRLQLRRPHQHENGARLQEQRVRAVIDVLPAEIPDPERGGIAGRGQRRSADLDAMR